MLISRFDSLSPLCALCLLYRHFWLSHQCIYLRIPGIQSRTLHRVTMHYMDLSHPVCRPGSLLSSSNPCLFIIREKHTNGDVDVTEEEYNKLQQVINAHAVSWVRMLNAGTGNNEQTRVKNNMIGTDSLIEPLYGLLKDHKPCQNNTEGPPFDRNSVCGAAASYSNRLSHIISMILTEL